MGRRYAWPQLPELSERLGVVSYTVGGWEPGDVARRTKALGVRTVQLMAVADQSGEPGAFLGGTLGEWIRAYAREGVEVCAVGCYVNVVHPDPEIRKLGLNQLKACLGQAGALGIRLVSTETGTYNRASDWASAPDNRTPSAIDDLRAVTEDLLQVAFDAGVVLLYEPYVANVLHSPRIAADFVRQYDSPHLALVMDPTNWFEADDVNREGVQRLLHSGFEAERGLFQLAHAKDVSPPIDGQELPDLGGPGSGCLDYGLYTALLAEHSYAGPLILEHISEEQAPAALAFVRRLADGGGR